MSQDLTKTFTDKITSEFPEIKFASAKLITHGWDNNIIMLDDAFVFRFPKNDEYIKKFNIEVGLIKYLQKKSPIAIPNYAYLAKDRTFGGYPLIRGELLKPELLRAQTDIVK